MSATEAWKEDRPYTLIAVACCATAVLISLVLLVSITGNLVLVPAIALVLSCRNLIILARAIADNDRIFGAHP